ncbi:hypothetical protein [Nannocystis pusilla]
MTEIADKLAKVRSCLQASQLAAVRFQGPTGSRGRPPAARASC